MFVRFVRGVLSLVGRITFLYQYAATLDTPDAGLGIATNVALQD